METEIELGEDYFFESDEEYGNTECPNCGKEYDEIDYEYQICHFCGFNNSQKQ